MDNEPTGLAAYMDQQIAAARGEGVSGSDPSAADGAVLPDQEAVAPSADEANDALSGDDVAPEDETAADAAPDSEEAAVSPDIAAIRQELDALRAEKEDRERKDAEAQLAAARAEAERRQQEQIAVFDQQFAEFEQYEDGLGRRAKALAAQMAAYALNIAKNETDRLQREADQHGRVGSALITTLQAQHPAVWEQIKPVVQTIMALNSPEEQGRYLQLVRSEADKATADKDKQIAALKRQLKNIELTNQKRELTGSDALAAGSGTPSIAAPNGESKDAPLSFDEWFGRQAAQARAEMAGLA